MQHAKNETSKSKCQLRICFGKTHNQKEHIVQVAGVGFLVCSQLELNGGWKWNRKLQF